MKPFFKIILLFAGLFSIVSCTDHASEKPVGQNIPESKISGPFHFYKNIEIRPGINFEVVSWGRGVDSLGGYLVLMSDTLKNNYKSLSNEREGIITDAWNMDLDNDGNPEIYIEFSKQHILDLNVYEYSSGSFNKITFPGLNESLKKNYGGNDKFFMKEGELFRSFPLVNPKDSTQKAGELKTVRYRLSSNSFSSSEVKE
ncbi:hypothetical protein [Pedobacter metabolipauper]|uniref:Uncharacterized protein n=1 Tax=Pedobacter metabolipauper TaxID=425513 RepID=A0A4R6SQA3_9SPHI|nr:hypothetical protein [Pedobacter metabolipauper]TDQ06404.1 hypothetical protein ATK78_4474 [Pedobacter metabolipauper]